MKAFVCALACALVASFALGASAQGWDEAVDDTDAPYIDAEGNADYELAKDYAELVDAYVAKDGVKWEVWLDEVAGFMWVEPKGGASTLDLPRGLPVPEYVRVYNSGGSCYYDSDGPDGLLYYDEEISCSGADFCFRWYICDIECGPNDATRIAGRAKGTGDYCDDYYEEDGAWYAPPSAAVWLGYDPGYCFDTGSWYLYYVDNTGGFTGTADYEEEDRMVRWDVEVDDEIYSFRVYYWGACII